MTVRILHDVFVYSPLNLVTGLKGRGMTPERAALSPTEKEVLSIPYDTTPGKNSKGIAVARLPWSLFHPNNANPNEALWRSRQQVLDRYEKTHAAFEIVSPRGSAGETPYIVRVAIPPAAFSTAPSDLPNLKLPIFSLDGAPKRGEGLYRAVDEAISYLGNSLKRANMPTLPGKPKRKREPIAG